MKDFGFHSGFNTNMNFGFQQSFNSVLSVLPPTEIFGANLYDWWDYTDLATQSISGGGQINSIASKGTNGAVFGSSGTERPASIVGVNGLNVADFDGVNDFMLVNASRVMYKLLHDNTDSFVIMISKVNDANPNAVMRLLNTVVSINSDIGFALTYDDRSSIGRNNRIFANTSDGTSAVIRNISADNFFGTQQYNLLFSKNDPQNLTASQRNVLTTNNLLTSENNSLTGVTSTSISSYNLYIGATPSNTQNLKGQIAEIYILDAFPTPTQLTELNTYLTNKYGGTFPII